MENEEPPPLLVSFIASGQGAWRIERIDTIVGESLPAADRLEVVESPSPSLSVAPAWVLRGVTSNVRYTNRLELDAPTAEPRAAESAAGHASGSYPHPKDGGLVEPRAGRAATHL